MVRTVFWGLGLLVFFGLTSLGWESQAIARQKPRGAARAAKALTVAEVLNTLKSAHQLLLSADRDYDGHRALAAKEVHKALMEVGHRKLPTMAQPGAPVNTGAITSQKPTTNSGHAAAPREAQAASDVHCARLNSFCKRRSHTLRQASQSRRQRAGRDQPDPNSTHDQIGGRRVEVPIFSPSHAPRAHARPARLFRCHPPWHLASVTCSSTRNVWHPQVRISWMKCSFLPDQNAERPRAARKHSPLARNPAKIAL